MKPILDVVVPTYKRRSKLIRCIGSILNARMKCTRFDVRLHIYFSIQEEMDDIKEYEAGKEWITYHMYEPEFISSRFWNSHLLKMEADALCYLTDDVELESHCLIHGWHSLEQMDFDGVVGFKVDNALDGQPAKACYGMLGSKFAERFPDRRVFCPDYACFYLDEELEKYAESLGRFVFNQEARLLHFHPDFTQKEADECHIHHRRNKLIDVSTYRMRRNKGLIWGREFERIGSYGN